MSSIPVHIGRWHDHSRSGALGDTITLEVRWGILLIAALSTFVGIVGTALWSIVAFAVHQWRAKTESDDAVFFQQQVIYRNQGSAIGALLDLIGVCWAWRKKKRTGKRAARLKRRSILFMLPPLIVFAASVVIGIFISEVAGATYKSNNVRVESSNCGFWDFADQNETGVVAENVKAVNDTFTGRQYAKTCYHSKPTFETCDLYPVQSLPYNSSLVACPFGNDPRGQEACIPEGNKALQMDTGYMDTDKYLGINAPKSDRLLLRIAVTCAPIQSAAYRSLTSVDGGYETFLYDMGPTVVTAWTYRYNLHSITDIIPYQITSLVRFDRDNTSDWYLVKALNVEIIAVALLLEIVVEYYRKRKGRSTHREIARIADRKLQLHRMASLAGRHDHEWDELLDKVPITAFATFFLPLSWTSEAKNEYQYLDKNAEIRLQQPETNSPDERDSNGEADERIHATASGESKGADLVESEAQQPGSIPATSTKSSNEASANARDSAGVEEAIKADTAK